MHFSGGVSCVVRFRLRKQAVGRDSVNLSLRGGYHMCGIAGFYQSHFDYLTEEDHYRQILEDMEKVQKHRGPDEQEIIWTLILG